jgi:hypothetical protein
MGSPCCVSVSPPQQALIVDPEEMAVARQQLGKHVSTATNTHTIEELLDMVFSMWSMFYHILNM